MLLEVFGLSDKGRVRPSNEDAIFYGQRNHVLLAVVCDGIGGNESGEVAASLAVSCFEQAFETMPVLKQDYEVDRWLRLTINSINDRIRHDPLCTFQKKKMGTTLAGVLINNERTYLFNCGDSRIYALYPDGLVLMSKDHIHSRQDHKLTSALGIWDHIPIEINRIQSGYSSLLICTDGLYQELETGCLEEMLMQAGPIECKVESLIRKADVHGGQDNISAILIEPKNGQEALA